MKKKIIILWSVIILVIVSSSYALFRVNVTSGKDFRIVLGTLELEISDTKTEDMIIKENMIPQKESDALTQEGYTFTLKNKGTLSTYYTVFLDDVVPTGETKQKLTDDLLKINFSDSNNNKTYLLSDISDRILEKLVKVKHIH